MTTINTTKSKLTEYDGTMYSNNIITDNIVFVERYYSIHNICYVMYAVAVLLEKIGFHTSMQL